MKFYYTMTLLILLAVAGFFAWINWRVTGAMLDAAEAMTKVSLDYREASQNHQAERLRVGMALTQLEKDTMRLRTYLKRKGG